MDRTNHRILIVDDEQPFRTLLSRILADEGYTVLAVGNPAEALAALSSFEPALLITDLKMPGMDGIELMTAARRQRELDVILLTAFATVETAVDALKRGASDYLTKPLKSPDELRVAVAKVLERRELVSENRLLKSEQLSGLPPLEIVFAGMEAVLGSVQQVAATDATVLLLGETGTGKTLVAKVIHRLSGREGPFVDINCASIPEQLLESELFGHEKGAFTGAAALKKGKFEFAQDGSVLLDEIGEMSPALQAKLLRVLQERCFERVGSVRTVRTNARVLAATHRDLAQRVADRLFREDLYYRLNVFPIEIPPLRERKGALPGIARHLVGAIGRRLGKPDLEVDGEALARLADHAWPGNVRELENAIERAVIMSKGKALELHVPVAPGAPSVQRPQRAGDLKTLEQEAIRDALARTGGNRRLAAEQLGISLRTLQYKLNEYGMRER
jgi:DNA-binding NtrC family response regulator